MTVVCSKTSVALRLRKPAVEIPVDLKNSFIFKKYIKYTLTAFVSKALFNKFREQVKVVCELSLKKIFIVLSFLNHT